MRPIALFVRQAVGILVNRQPQLLQFAPRRRPRLFNHAWQLFRLCRRQQFRGLLLLNRRLNFGGQAVVR